MTPSGSARWISSIRSLTAETTTRAFAPLSCKANPVTTSPSPSCVAAPNRMAGPSSTSATSPSVTGVPPRVATTVLRRSPRSSTSPSVRTDQLLRAGLDVGGADVPGRLGRRVEHLAEREPVAREPVGVHEHLVLLEHPADGVDLGQARHAQELAADDPVLDRAELHRGVPARRVAERVPEDLAEARRDRPQLGRLGARRQLVVDPAEPLEDELAGEVGVDVLLEDDGDDGDPLARERPELDDVGERS